MQRKIETSELPAVFIRTGDCSWQLDDSGNQRQDRQIFVEVLVEPLTQNTIKANEALIDALIERIPQAYHDVCYKLGENCWILPDTINDGGIQTINLGTTYIGFVISFNVQIRKG